MYIMNVISYEKSTHKRECFNFTYKVVGFNGRDDRIRTCDLCVPNAALYQTEPHLEISSFICNVDIISYSSKKIKGFLRKMQKSFVVLQ